ncbi:gamma-mobile-trio protein GmtX [Vibrio sp. THAF190c]|uniref:gamma-mobile-trio protein GmtX n=1 Tax=Vibrio sp. THAF190c TaxID=2587865 RepID=UPI0012691F06|nr:gamma-mobile-trio protein GmtX [Vibrio sp. THAF190c]
MALQALGEKRLHKSLNKDQIVIDRSVRLPAPSKAKVELLPAVPISSMEIHALTTAIASQTLDENDWQANLDGSIRNQYERKIFEPGYVDAIEKVLEHTQK